jgi:hypothetical protein
LPTLLCLLKSEALGHSYDIGQRFRIHLRHGVATMDRDRDPANRRRNRFLSDPREFKGAFLKAVSRLNGNSQQITETRPISSLRGGFGLAC